MSTCTSLQYIEDAPVMLEFEHQKAERARGPEEGLPGPGCDEAFIVTRVALGADWVDVDNFCPRLVSKWEERIREEYQE